jgi:N4-gp56 family major capsid protein
MGQEWVTTSLGGVLANPELSKNLRIAAQPLMRFRQFCTMKEAFGKGKSDTLNFDKVSNLATAGGTLTETSTIPFTNYSIVKGTLTVNEMGNAASYTGKLEALAAMGVRQPTIKALKNDMVKVIDSAVCSQMTACKIRYVASTGSTGNFTTNGTATQTASGNLNAFHTKQMVDYLLALNAPAADGENYMGICTVKAARGIYDDLTPLWQYTKYPVNGEIGNFYKVRFVRDTYSMNNGIGTSGTAAGEAYFFGEDAVLEAVTLPEEIRYEEKDFGRSQRVAWYAILGFKIIWEGDPDNRIIKFDSA